MSDIVTFIKPIPVKDRELGPIILTHPQIPKPLHGLNPRTILGKTWWEMARHAAYRRADYKCECCGVPKQEALFHKWLEAHEIYDFDYKHGRLTYKYLVALCHACHNYIHRGRLLALYDKGEIDADKYHTICEHGDRLLQRHKIKSIETEHHPVNWADWRMIICGKEYKPQFDSYEDWLAHYGYNKPRYSTGLIGAWDDIDSGENHHYSDAILDIELD